MSEQGAFPVIRDPEEELRAVYEARIRPFADLGSTEKAAQYQGAHEIARRHLARAREQAEGHVA
jgi:hypothetical protein